MKVDLSVVTDTMSALKAASDLAFAAKELEDIPALKRKLAEMATLLLSAHSAAASTQVQLMGMMQENSELQSKLSKIESWEEIACRYQLKDFGGGTFAYELKADAAGGEPPHLLCPNCFQTQRKSLLQFSHDTPTHQKLFKCRACSQDFPLGVRSRSDDWRAGRNNSGWAV